MYLIFILNLLIILHNTFFRQGKLMNKDYELAVAKPLQFAKDYGIDVSSVPAERGFFIVFGCSCKQAEKYGSNIEGHYIIQTYDNDGVKLGEILESYIRTYGGYPDINKIRFQISDGRFLDGDLTVAVLAKKAELENVEGMFLYIDYRNEAKDWVIRQHFETGDDTKIIDECALQQMYTNIPKSQNKSTICINFLLPGNMHQQEIKITVKRQLKSTFNQFKQTFWDKLKKYYEFNPKFAEDSRYVIEARRKTDKDQEISKKEHVRSVKYVNNLFNWCNVRVELPEMATMKKKINKDKKSTEGRLFIQKENSQDYIDVEFERIQFMSFHTLYHLMLVPEKKRNDKSNKMCLKVMDILIHEDQDLSCLAPFYQNDQKNQYVRLVGKVVSEKMHFYNTMIERNIDSKKEGFSIKSYIRSSLGENPTHFENRVDTAIKERAFKSQIQYFKDPRHVEPLYIYTAEDIHVINKNKTSTPVYSHVNLHNRDKCLLNIPKEQLKRIWEYTYTSKVMSQLRELEEQKTTVYRGARYNPQIKKGEINTFKTFTSTSALRKEAQKFLYMQSDNPEKTLFIMHIKNGRKIDKYSAFPKQSQILVEPYTQFEVLSVKEPQKKGNQTIPYRVIELNELDEKLSSKQFPLTQSHFVLWVDRPNSTDPFDVFSSITRFGDSTVLIVFHSTQELGDWLKGQKAKRIFKDKTSNIVFLTNMTRIEANEENPIAGIEAIRKLQQACVWEIPVMLYVGDRKRAQEKIQANRNQLQNHTHIKIGINYDQARHFLAEYILCEFKNIKSKIKK